MNQMNECPICGSSHEIEEQFCSRCGWEFRLFPEIVPETVLSNEEKRIAAFRNAYEQNGKQRKMISDLDETIASLKKEKEYMLKKHKETIDALQETLKKTESDLINARSDCKLAKQKVSELTNELSTKQLEYEHLQSENVGLKNTLNAVHEDYKGYISPKEMISFKDRIKSRINKLYDEIEYQKKEISRLRQSGRL